MCGFDACGCTTVSDLFEDRFASRGLSMFYALFQILVACVFLGFGNVVAYRIASSLVVKPEATWTVAERASVEGYHELRRLEKEATAGTLTSEMKPRLDMLRDRNARGALHSYITLLNEVVFYVGFAIVVGTYIVLGGMAAAAVNEGLQSILIIVFSALLIPTGIHAIGGWSMLAEKVPADFFRLFGAAGSAQFSGVESRRHSSRESRADTRPQPQHGHLRFGQERVRRPDRRFRKLSEANHDHPVGVRRVDRRRAVRGGRTFRSGFGLGCHVEQAAWARLDRADARRRARRYHVHARREGVGDFVAICAKRLSSDLARHHAGAGRLLCAVHASPRCSSSVRSPRG